MKNPRNNRKRCLLQRWAVVLLLILWNPISSAQEQPDLTRLVDIAPAYVREGGQDSANITRGREVLDRALHTLGHDQWKSHAMLEVEAKDIWAKSDRWWPAKEQSFKAQYLLGTFTSRMELTDGSWKGSVLGVQSWQGYKRKGESAALVQSSDPLLLFYLPSLQYFNELPFRLASTPIIIYAGEVQHRGKMHDLVYCTWSSMVAHAEHDQYVLWIDRETSLVTMCHYTVRQAFPAAAGTIYFDSYRKVQGVQFPFRHFVLLEWPDELRFPLEQNFFHRMEIYSARFGSVARNVLLPLSGLPKPRDWKPNTPIQWDAK